MHNYNDIYNYNYSIYTPPRRSAIPKSVEAQSNVNAPRTRHLTIHSIFWESERYVCKKLIVIIIDYTTITSYQRAIRRRR